jgi:hypothetical protein
MIPLHAVHSPAPFLHARELLLPAALPLGMSQAAGYEAAAPDLHVDEPLTFYRDGLLEPAMRRVRFSALTA